MRPMLVAASVLAVLLPGYSLAGDAAKPAADVTYEQDVRPILKTFCFHCHGEGEELAGGLDLRLRRLIAHGGDSGPGLVAGKVAESLLLERMRAGEMPPEDAEQRPTAAQVTLIERWIAAGAKTVREEPEQIGDGFYLTEEERNFWSFQPITRPEPPKVKSEVSIRTPIDRFVLAKLEAAGYSFSAEAQRHTLLRRVYFDLLGLPPSPEETARFLADESPDAYEQLIDRLLDSPHYGERWARHWLDVAGYADSEGYTDDDLVRADAYKYRDYLIRSLNADKPLDQFVREQLAGDEMLRPPFENLTPEDAEKLIATGFLRMAPDGTGTSGVDQGVARNQVVADTVQIVSTSLLGLTVGCAQCHNHRYDPIPQADYYRFRGIFEPALDWKAWRSPKQRRISLYTDADREKAREIEEEAKKIDAERLAKQEEYIEQTFEKELAKLPEELREPIREARDTAEKQRSAEQKKLLKEHPSVNVSAGSLYLYDKKAADDLKQFAARAAKHRQTKPVEQFVRALTEPADKPPPATFLFSRGDHEQPKQQLKPAELTVLTVATQVELPEDDAELPTTGRRLAYARWLTSGQHPLLARVLVNRVWLHHFGRGIVATPGDFGYLGERPSHPELLDWLADELVREGWSLKRLHKLMMTSTVYRQSSRRTPELEEVDQDNGLYGRMSVRRLEAEVIRDAVLAISGKLNRKAFGPPVPVMADQVGRFVIGIENLNAGRPGAVIPMKGEEFRRSVYIQVRRTRPLSVMDPFDIPAMAPNCTVRSTSTVTPQSLALMNGDFTIAHARHLAERVKSEAGNDMQQKVAHAWLAIFATEPDEQQVADAVAFLDIQREQFQTAGGTSKEKVSEADASKQAMASLCHALLSSNQFLYVD